MGFIPFKHCNQMVPGREEIRYLKKQAATGKKII